MPDVDQLQSDTKAELNTPLIIMDGFEITLERMMDLDDSEVETITLLKDASATAIYGSSWCERSDCDYNERARTRKAAVFLYGKFKS